MNDSETMRSRILLLEGLELIIFDFDGVLVSSKQMYLYVFKKAVGKQDYNYTYEKIEPLLGQKVEKKYFIFLT